MSAAGLETPYTAAHLRKGEVVTRNTVARILLILYALGCLAVTLTQLLNGPGSVDMAWTTSGKILAAATFALGSGSAMASRDPWQNRLVIQILMVFMAGTTLAIVYRILTHGEVPPGESTWIVLAAAATAPVLVAVFYPRPPQERRRVPARQMQQRPLRPPGAGEGRSTDAWSPGSRTSWLGEAANA